MYLYQERTEILDKIQVALHNVDMADQSLKPQQVRCFDFIDKGHDIIAVLPTGFGMSVLFQLLPDILPAKTKINIVTME